MQACIPVLSSGLHYFSANLAISVCLTVIVRCVCQYALQNLQLCQVTIKLAANSLDKPDYSGSIDVTMCAKQVFNIIAPVHTFATASCVARLFCTHGQGSNSKPKSKLNLKLKYNFLLHQFASLSVLHLFAPLIMLNELTCQIVLQHGT